MKNIPLVALLFAIFFAFPALGSEVIDADSHSKKRGNTSVSGSYKLTQVTDKKVTLEMKIKVKKTGVSGTGQGVVVFALIDDSGKPIIEKKLQLTVGSHALKGVARKEKSQKWTLLGNKAKKIVSGDLSELAFLVDATKDSSGLCQTKKCWEDAAKTSAWVIKAYSDL